MIRFVQITAILILAVCLFSPVRAADPAEPAPPPKPPRQVYVVKPLELSWWLAFLGDLARRTPAAVQVANSGTDLNQLLASQPSAAGNPNAAGNASAYVARQTAYGTIPVFNHGDPTAWKKFFANPYQFPNQAIAKQAEP